MTKNEGKWTNRVYDEDRPSAYQIDRDMGNRKTAHGEDGHTGWKCPECAMEAKVVVSAFPLHDDDGWQNILLDWQEECDKLHSAKINHLPEHQPTNISSTCSVVREECVLYEQDPTKPIKQFERLNSRIWIGDGDE